MFHLKHDRMSFHCQIRRFEGSLDCSIALMFSRTFVLFIFFLILMCDLRQQVKILINLQLIHLYQYRLILIDLLNLLFF